MRLFIALCLSASPAAAAGPAVELVRVPQAGILPEVAIDERGQLHLLYFAGEPAAGDLYYTVADLDPAADPRALALRFTTPVRVNSRPGTAIAVGSVRSGHLALGAGRAHVAWMSADNADPGMYYTRDGGDGRFEPQRNVAQRETGLDGGGSLAADDGGHVYVAWHAGLQGEETRRLWVAASSDTGRTFASERRANPVETGACGCCGMRAAAAADGALYLLFRAATAQVHRDMQLLRSADGGRSFSQEMVHPWELGACPMSTAAIAPGAAGALLAWETEGQIYWRRVGPAAAASTSAPDTVAARAPAMGGPQPLSAPGTGGGRKHPALAVDGQGRVALVWTEGTGWMQGGDLAWQVYAADGAPLETGRLAGAIPVWSRAAVVARPGGFAILY